MKIFEFFNKKKDNIKATRRAFGKSGGTIVTDDTAMQSSAFFRGVIYISTQIAKLPWQIKNSSNKVVDNDLSYYLNVQPNEEMTAMHFKMCLIQAALQLGNGYAEIQRYPDGRIAGLWPLDPKSVCPIRDATGKLFYRVIYQDETVYIAPRDLFIVRNPHTKDGIQGLGLVGYMLDTLGIAIGADRFANNLFANGGMPSSILEHPGTLSDEAYKRLKESWSEQNNGRKSGSVAILEEGTKFNTVSLDPDVMQFLESRKFSVTEIARFLGIPPTMLYDSDSAKFNNVEHQNLQVATDTLDTWARILESEADIKLLNGRRGGMRTELDLYAVFRGDMVTRAKYFQIMQQTASMTSNEIRTREGLTPYDGGDRFYIASNNLTPTDRVDEVIDSNIGDKQDTGTQDQIEEDPEDMQDEDDPINKALTEYITRKIQN